MNIVKKTQVRMRYPSAIICWAVTVPRETTKRPTTELLALIIVVHSANVIGTITLSCWEGSRPLSTAELVCF